MSIVRFIIAMDENRGIGLNGHLPWSNPEDLSYFYNKTKNSTVVMGRKTYLSLPFDKFENRHNIVVTSRKTHLKDVQVVNDPIEYIESLKEDIWVIGGKIIYNLFLPYADELYITRIPGTYACDTYMDNIEDGFELKEEINGLTCKFEVYQRKNESIII